MQASLGDRRGFSLTELLVSIAMMSLIMAGAFSAMLSATRANESVKLVTGMNNNLRVGMDLILRDLVQAGQGLPAGRVVSVPFGAGALPIRRPGRAPDTLTFDPASPTISAVTVGPGLGPTINGAPTDMITVLAADNAFDNVRLTALDDLGMAVDPAVNISDMPDVLGNNIRVGDLILLTKQSFNVLKYVTAVNAQTVEFDPGDPLQLNQIGVDDGTLAEYVAEAPLETQTAGFVPSRATRIRMISYYLETPDGGDRDLRLIRRVNNNPPTTVAFSIERFTVSFDLVDGVTNPVNVAMNAADLAGTGACDPDPGTPPVIACSPNLIRKVNLRLTGRSLQPLQQTGQFFRNTLNTQVSLRSLALVDRYS